MASASATPGEPPVIPREQLIKVKEYPAASGGYGQVFQCVMRPPAAPEILVAVKVLMRLPEHTSNKRARREMKLWMEARHENIVPMLGITEGFSEEGFAMVCPWMEGGTLAQYLKDHKGNMPFRNKMTLIKDIASGLAYLHSRQIVHGDLTTQNIMLDDSERALLIDFGLSNVLGGMVGSCLSLSIARPGAVRFAAPELLGVEEAASQSTGECSPVHNQSPMPDVHSDVYSLGCVMLNVLTEQQPWHYLHATWAIIGAIHARKPFPITDHVHLSEKRRQFVCDCTSVRIKGRPSSQDAVVFVEEELRIEGIAAPIQPSMPVASKRDDLSFAMHKLDTKTSHQVTLASTLVGGGQNTEAQGQDASAFIREMKPDVSSQYPLSPVQDMSNTERPSPDVVNLTSREHLTIVITGAIGSGKSSLVNLLSGKCVAHTSNDAGRCTKQRKDYSISFCDTVYRVFDTVGFARSNGTPLTPKERSEKYPKQQIREIHEQTGIDLLLFCVSSRNFHVEAMLDDYRKIQDELRGRQVPVVLVVTHVEEPFAIESWWSKTLSTFRAQLNTISNHICITSIHDKYLYESREHIFQMIAQHCTSDARGSQQPTSGGVHSPSNPKTFLGDVARALHITQLSTQIREVVAHGLGLRLRSS
ncbi:kinase-like domain-containing protein [Suillus ampliporus]|nr:kinase-like domain-containing protein [Suillus ampliporus]